MPKKKEDDDKSKETKKKKSSKVAPVDAVLVNETLEKKKSTDQSAESTKVKTSTDAKKKADKSESKKKKDKEHKDKLKPSTDKKENEEKKKADKSKLDKPSKESSAKKLEKVEKAAPRVKTKEEKKEKPVPLLVVTDLDGPSDDGEKEKKTTAEDQEAVNDRVELEEKAKPSTLYPEDSGKKSLENAGENKSNQEGSKTERIADSEITQKQKKSAQEKVTKSSSVVHSESQDLEKTAKKNPASAKQETKEQEKRDQEKRKQEKKEQEKVSEAKQRTEEKHQKDLEREKRKLEKEREEIKKEREKAAALVVAANIKTEKEKQKAAKQVEKIKKEQEKQQKREEKAKRQEERERKKAEKEAKREAKEKRKEEREREKAEKERQKEERREQKKEEIKKKQREREERSLARKTEQEGLKAQMLQLAEEKQRLEQLVTTGAVATGVAANTMTANQRQQKTDELEAMRRREKELLVQQQKLEKERKEDEKRMQEEQKALQKIEKESQKSAAHNCWWKTIRMLLIVLNAIFFVFFLVIFAVGLYLRLDKTALELFSEDFAHGVGVLSPYYIISYVLIAVGLIMAIVLFDGMYGSFKEDQCSLVFFAVMIGAVGGFMIIFAIVFMSDNQRWVTYVTEYMQTLILSDYVSVYGARTVVNNMQAFIGCCGAYNSSDYITNEWESSPHNSNNGTYPSSCVCDQPTLSSCKRSALNVSGLLLFEQGCGTIMADYVRNHSDVVGGTLIGLSCLVVCSCVFSCMWCVRIRIHKQRRQKVGVLLMEEEQKMRKRELDRAKKKRKDLEKMENTTIV